MQLLFFFFTENSEFSQVHVYIFQLCAFSILCGIISKLRCNFTIPWNVRTTRYKIQRMNDFSLISEFISLNSDKTFWIQYWVHILQFWSYHIVVMWLHYSLITAINWNLVIVIILCEWVFIARTPIFPSKICRFALDLHWRISNIVFQGF